MKKKVSVSIVSVLLALVLILPLSMEQTVRADNSTIYSYTVRVTTGYLALRTAQDYDYRNEIGEIYTGQTVQVYDYNRTNSTYWWVYAPTLGKSGYVNKNYLFDPVVISSGVEGSTMTVKVQSGYLALRTAKAYDYRNEIGELYTGDTVTISDASDSTYWWVYSPKLNKYGYVNKNYLVSGGSSSHGSTYTVSVQTGYLALRNAMAYDYRNEIGKLYTGDTVEVQDYSDSTYWWVYSPKLGKYGYVNRNYLY